jgi:hypothetical protein
MLEEIVAAETISWLMNSLLHCFCLNLLPTRNPSAEIFNYTPVFCFVIVTFRKVSYNF